MAFIPLPNGFKIAMEYTLNGQLVVNVYHVTSALPVNSTNLTALANVFISWWQNNQRQNFSTGIALTKVVVTDIRVANGLQYQTLVTTNNAGTVAGSPSPNNVAAVTSWRTGFSGRSFRGRTYMAGFPQTEVSDNFLSAGLVSALILDATALITQLSTAGFTLVVKSDYTNGAPRITAVGTPINAVIQDNRIDTQRRRLPGTGE